VAKCILGEISDSTNKARAFALIGTNYGIGIMIGPMLGGLLSNPSTNYPDTFGHFKLFIDNPYLLPCLFAASVSTFGFFVGLFFLPETCKNLNPRRYEQIAQDDPVEEEITPLIECSDTVIRCSESTAHEEISSEHDEVINEDISETPKSIGKCAVVTSLAYGLIAFQSLFFIEVTESNADLPFMGGGTSRYWLGF
jgi:MFS family permease